MHGTIGETPKDRFMREEAAALKPLGMPSFTTARDLMRSVGADCAVAVDGNVYSVPWQLIGERVRITVSNRMLRIHHGGREVAVHAELPGRYGRAVDDTHLAGLVGSMPRPAVKAAAPVSSPVAIPALLRPLAEYEAVAGGSF
jgi:hypothetical protein